MTQARNIDLDALKGLAILAVVFYHLGILPFGYLGVDIFLVLNGYFITHSMLYHFSKREFSYTGFLKKRLARLWPLVVIASFVSLLIGYFVMLPDDYENLSQSVVASNAFANNILSAITTNYWDVATSYKPLMHTWYIGILVQCYIIFPLFIWVITKLGHKRGRNILLALTVVFASLYLLPLFPETQKFYFLPFRLFEFLIGSVIAAYVSEVKTIKRIRPIYILCVLLILCLCLDTIPDISNNLKVLLTSVLTGIAILLSIYKQRQYSKNSNYFYLLLASIGSMSYSIFIWHQVLIAFYKYSICSVLNIFDYLLLLLIISIFSFLSYKYIENPLSRVKGKKINRLLVACLCGGIIMAGCGLYIYSRAGVIRDVPELGVSTNNIKRGMHGAYCDRIYNYEHPFQNNGKKKVLGIGNSFVRDMLNILLESEYSDSLDISYVYTGHINAENEGLISSRIDSASVVFFNCHLKDMPSITNKLSEKPNAYYVGTKSFGESNGIIYCKRQSKDYFSSTVKLSPSFEETYKEEKALWGSKYLDMIEPLVDKDGNMPIFTSDSMFISQDCRHLTQAGAKFYSKKLNLANYLEQPTPN